MARKQTDWATRIRRLRKRLGLSQHAFGIRLGMSPQSAGMMVCRWERAGPDKKPDRRYRVALEKLERGE